MRWSRGKSCEPASSHEAQATLKNLLFKVSYAGKVSSAGFIHHSYWLIIFPVGVFAPPTTPIHFSQLQQLLTGLYRWGLTGPPSGCS